MTTECIGNGTGNGLAEKRTSTRPTLAQHRAAKLDFIHGKGSIKTISERYGLKWLTVQGWSHNEDWTGLRRAFHEQKDREIENVIQPLPEPAPAKEQATDPVSNVKAQIESIDEQMKTCDDPLMLSRLADAKSKLWNLIYPKPGTARMRRGSVTHPGQTQPGPVRLNPVPVSDSGLGSTLPEPKAEPVTEQTPQELG